MAGDLSTTSTRVDAGPEGRAEVVGGRSEQQATILAAAVDILRTDGAQALTVRNVANAAGCSTTGVYTWFGGKQGLVDTIYMDGFDSFDAALASVPNENGPGGSGADWLVARALAYREWALAHPTEYQVMFARIVPEHEPSDAARQRGLRSFASHVSSVERVQEGGELVGHGAEGVAYHLWATIHGHVMLELSGMDGGLVGPEGGVRPPVDQRIEQGLRATLAGYAAQL